MSIDYKQLAVEMVRASREPAKQARQAFDLAFDQGVVAGRLLFTEGHSCPRSPIGLESDEQAHRAGIRCGWIAERQHTMNQLQQLANGGQR